MDYTLVNCTERLTEAVKCADDDDSELKEWREKSDGSTMPFSLVRKLHTRMSQSAKPSANKVYLHELLEGSELVLPMPSAQPTRSAELEAHLARLRAKAEQKEYNRMTRNVDIAANQMERFKLGIEIQSVSRQICAIINFLLTVIGAFAFGYCAGYYADYSIPTCVFIGLTLAILVFLADLYFLVRVPQEKKTSRAKIQ